MRDRIRRSRRQRVLGFGSTFISTAFSLDVSRVSLFACRLALLPLRCEVFCVGLRFRLQL